MRRRLARTLRRIATKIDNPRERPSLQKHRVSYHIPQGWAPITHRGTP